MQRAGFQFLFAVFATVDFRDFVLGQFVQYAETLGKLGIKHFLDFMPGDVIRDQHHAEPGQQEKSEQDQ